MLAGRYLATKTLALIQVIGFMLLARGHFH